MNDFNNTDNQANAQRLISTQRDFNRHINLGDNKSKFSTISDLFTAPKIRYISTIAIISIIIYWIFLGKHNSRELIPNQISQLELLEQTEQIEQTNETKKSDIIKQSNQDLTNKKYKQYSSQQIALPDLTAYLKSEAPENLMHLDSTTPKSDANSNSKTNNLITKTIKIKRNDNLTTIFNKLNIDKEDLYKIINNKKINSYIKKIRPGQKLDITYNKQTGKLDTIVYFLDKLNTYKIYIDKDDSNNLIGKKEKLTVNERESFAELKIKSSLFEDAQKQNLPIDLVFQIINIFAWDIDFAQDLRKDDSVEILYRDYYLDGSKYSTGPILAVNFHNNGKTYSAIRYESADGKTADYYTPEGLSLRKAFIRTPVKFTRISSKFNLGRKHPILHKIRAHRGVDYAAPTGTPIKAAGDGKVIHYGRKGGYGKAAIIQHGKKYTTLYAHMSRYNNKIRRGSIVKQGQIIGYVGQTGLASGPHLHFEFRVDGVHKNPLTVPLPKAKPIASKHKIKYIDDANKILAKISRYKDYQDNNIQIASNQKFE